VRRAYVLLLLVGSWVLLPGLAGAQTIYRWVDDEGTVHYSTGIESVPERFRPVAEPLGVPTAPQAPQPPQGAASGRVVTIPFTRGSAILVSTRINGLGPLTLILDTGADRTMVAPEALGRLGIQTPNTFQAKIRGVTGVAQADIVWVTSVTVGDATVGPMAIVAHDASLRGADGLLGRDFLAVFTVTIDAEASVVTLTRK